MKKVWTKVAMLAVALTAVQAFGKGADFVPPQLTLDATTLPTGVADRAPEAFITLYFENDGAFVHPRGSDKHYTNGVGFSVAAQPAWARTLGQWVPSFGNEFGGDVGTSYAVGMEAAQDIYTPSDLSISAPITNDRPYAGWLFGGVFLQRELVPAGQELGWNAATMEHFQLDIGTTGSASQADRTQKFVHTHISTDAVQPQGWQNQIHDEIGFNLTYIRKWRFTLNAPTDTWMPTAQVIPEAGLTVGTISRYALAGVTARAGWGGLPDDFGPGRLHEVGAYTGDHSQAGMLGFYVFGRAGGQLVEHNTFLEGNNFRDSQGVNEKPVVGEFQAGAALQFLKHAELVYSQTLRTQEFDGQDGADVYGALSLTMFWSF